MSILKFPESTAGDVAKVSLVEVEAEACVEEASVVIEVDTSATLSIL